MAPRPSATEEPAVEGRHGLDFARALAARDRTALLGVLDPHLEFRALTPRRYWEADQAQEVVDAIVLGTWFSGDDTVMELMEVDSAEVGGRRRVGYRLRVQNPEGIFLVEQQAYYEVGADDRIGWLRIMCAGYQPFS